MPMFSNNLCSTQLLGDSTSWADPEDSVSSDEEFTVTTPNELNASILSLDKTWTPIKGKFQEDFNTVSRSRRYAVLRKGRSAVNTVLHEIANGQERVIPEHIAKKYATLNLKATSSYRSKKQFKTHRYKAI